MMQHRSAEQWPTTTLPDVWFVYRTNPANSFWDTEAVIDAISHFPFTVCFAYTLDETNYMADVLLPDCTDLESLQLIRIGGTKYFEQFWHKQGFALRQPVTESPVDARDFSWIATELADRVGVLPAYNRAINRGDAGVRLHGKNYDHSLEEDEKHSVEAIWDAACRSASAEQSDGVSNHGLDYFREKGFMVTDFSQVDWYLYPEIHRQGLRFEMPYQERLKRICAQLANRLHESDIHWWDTQLDEYEPIPKWRNYPAIWDQALEANFPVKARDYPYWLMTARSMQYSWGNNADIQMIREAAGNIVGHNGVILNTGLARKLGIKDGELLEIASPLNSTRGHAVLRQGIRPDSLLMIGQFDHWATPLAKTFQVPSMNSLVPMLLDLTDSTGSGADLIKVKISKVETNQ